MRKLEVNPSANDHDSIKKQQNWLKQHTVNFAFKGDEYLPNPDSKLFLKFNYATYKTYELDED